MKMENVMEFHRAYQWSHYQLFGAVQYNVKYQVSQSLGGKDV